ncbi:MAG: DNA repair protein RecN [Bacillota bacterium]
MLINMFIRDFGIIEKTEINFTPGLNVLSGETGAGKSIIIDALQIATGARASTDYIRAGCNRAIVQITADCSKLPNLEKMLTDRGIAVDETGLVILTRELSIGGRSLCRINGQPVTLNVYREIGQQIVDIQGQHEQQQLFVPEKQLQLLDLYGGKDVTEAVCRVEQQYKKYRQSKGLLENLKKNHREMVRRQDTLKFQIEEINSVSPGPGEDIVLLAEKRKMANSEKLSRLMGECSSFLCGGGSDTSSLDLTGRAVKTLTAAAGLDDGLSRIKELVEGAYYQLEEACHNISAYMDSLEYYPEKLESVENRLDQINRLKKKYGSTVEEVLKYRDDIEKELEEIDSGDRKAELMEKELESLFQSLQALAGDLSEKRKKAAAGLEGDIASELEKLGMGGAKFIINFTALDEISEKGLERAEYYISANPGEPVKPLSKIASGGESSRLLLAIKNVLASIEDTPTMVFDEIDAGIGGYAIRAVAMRLFKLSEKKQVISVTHSPNIASMAHNHLLITKSESGGRTVSGIIQLKGEERKRELARMLGGGQDSGTALNHATHMLEEAKKLKEN